MMAGAETLAIVLRLGLGCRCPGGQEPVCEVQKVAALIWGCAVCESTTKTSRQMQCCCWTRCDGFARRVQEGE